MRSAIAYCASCLVALKNNQLTILLYGAVVLLYLVLAIPFALHGPFNPDEGWYLYSAWQTWQGEVPYQDFAFPQPPGTLLAHGLFQVLFGPGFYLGRIINVFMGALAIIIAMRASYAFYPKIWSSLAVGFLLAASPWWAYHGAVVSTYIVASLCLALELLAIARGRWGQAGWWLVATVVTRLTLVPVAVLLMLLWLVTSRQLHGLRQGVVGAGLAALVLLGSVFLPHFEKAWVNIVGYHTYTRQGLTAPLAENQQELLWQFVQGDWWGLYGWPWGLALVGMLAAFLFKKRLGLILFILLGATAINSLLHTPAASITYDVPLLLPLAVIGGVGLSSVIGAVRRPSVQFLLLAILLLTVGSGLVRSQEPFVLGDGEHEEGHVNIQRLARYLRDHTARDDIIFTPELYLSLEAQRKSLPGTELGRFFYFPEFSTKEAQFRGLMNDQLFTEAIQSRQAAFVVVSMAQFWNNVEDHEHQQRLLNVIEQAGYRSVDELHGMLPIIEATRVYERI